MFRRTAFSGRPDLNIWQFPAELNKQMNLPSPSDLRTALSALYPDASQLESAIQQLANSAPPELPQIEGVDVDLQRQSRCGFPEVVFGEGKSTKTILKILQAQQHAGQDSLVTRIRPDQVKTIQSEFENVIRNDTARTIRLHQPCENPVSQGGPVIVITAGSSDRHVA